MPQGLVRGGRKKTARRKRTVKEDRNEIRGLRKRYGADDSFELKRAAYKRKR
jgi:hypothetical protein